MKPLLDFIPLIVFFYLYKTVDKNDPNHPILAFLGVAGTNNNHILAATVGLIVAMVLVYGFLFVHQKFRLEKQQWFVLLMTVVFGGLTLALSDDYYIRLKAILINIAFGIGLLLSPLFLKDKQPFVQKILAPVFRLSQKGWQRLNWAWSVMFFVMAGLHAFFAFVFAHGEYWGEFTAFGDMIVLFVFLAGVFFVLRKHIHLEENPKL